MIRSAAGRHHSQISPRRAWDWLSTPGGLFGGGAFPQGPGYVRRVAQDGTVRLWTDLLDALFINGCTIHPDGKTLLTCESMPKKAPPLFLSRPIPGRLALAAAESSALEAQLNERLSGYDQGLLDLGRTLASECAKDYPNGPLCWTEIASGFIGGLIARHTSGLESRA